MKIVETKPRKAKFGFRYNITMYGDLLEKAKNAREFADVCMFVHDTLGTPDRENWWYEMSNRNNAVDELLIYINDLALYEKFKATVDSVSL